MRNNASEPTLGHVIMFGAAAAGWLILFLINLTMYTPTAGWWVKAAFSGALLVGSIVFAIVLLRRLGRKKTTERN